jgi:phosphatidylserine decarboxylase
MNDRKPSAGARLFVALQYVLPQHFLSMLMYRLARVTWAPMRWLLLRAFVRLVGIDMQEAAEPRISAYTHLNALFTRALRTDARPLDPDPHAIVCPVDGTISQIGPIAEGRIVQAKGHSYSVQDLLGGGEEIGRQFEGGSFATIYLSPKDYHRIHMPLAGELREATYIGGRLFSVNAVTATLVPGLFARNERVVSVFDTDAGPMAMVLVGAIFVGGIETVWAGEISPSLAGSGRQHWNYIREDTRPSLDRGAEMGRFNLGSTVVLLLPADAVDWSLTLEPGSKVRMGERIGTRRN